jgi:hypothetical protein
VLVVYDGSARNLAILTEKGACERLLTGLELWTKIGEARLSNEAIKLGLEVMALFSVHHGLSSLIDCFVSYEI